MLVGYARVSTQDQNLDRQLDQLRDAGCERVYTDKASGAKAERDGLDKMLEILRDGDTVVVVSLDRLGRSTKQVLSLVERLDGMGVGVTSLKEGFQAWTPHGRFFLTICSAFAELERGMIVDRTKQGLEAARRRGNVGGRPKADPEKVEMALSLYQAGKPVSFITKHAGISAKTLYRALEARPEIAQRQPKK